MKNIFATVLFCSLIGTPAVAQSGLNIYVGGGGAMPLDPTEFSDFWELGYGAGAAIGYSFGSSLELIGGVDYSKFSLDGDALIDDLGDFGTDIDISGGDISMLSFSAGLKFNIGTGGSLSPYLLGMGGMYTLSISDATVSIDGFSETAEFVEEETAFGAAFGGGFEIGFSSKASLFVQSTYRIAFTEEESTKYWPVKIGLVFGM